MEVAEICTASVGLVALLAPRASARMRVDVSRLRCGLVYVYQCGDAVKLVFGFFMVVLKTRDIFMKVNVILQFLFQFLCVLPCLLGNL